MTLVTNFQLCHDSCVMTFKAGTIRIPLPVLVEQIDEISSESLPPELCLGMASYINIMPRLNGSQTR